MFVTSITKPFSPMDRNGAAVPSKPQPIPSRARSSSKSTSRLRLEIRRRGAEGRDEAEHCRAIVVVEVTEVERARVDLVVLRVRLGDERGAGAVEVEELRVAAVDREEIEAQLARDGVHDAPVRCVRCRRTRPPVASRVGLKSDADAFAESLDALADGNRRRC